MALTQAHPPSQGLPQLKRLHTERGSIVQPLVHPRLSDAQEVILTNEHHDPSESSYSSAHLTALSWKRHASSSSSSTVYSRPCFGQEGSASFNQNVADGHTELSMCLPFDIRGLTATDLASISRQAWRAIRSIRPECAVKLSMGTERPQTMTFRDYHELGGAHEEAWLQDTFRVEQATKDRTWWDVAKETYRSKLDTQGKRSRMILVLAPQEPLTTARSDEYDEDLELSSHCLIWHVSHAVTDGFSFNVFLNTYLQLIVDGVRPSSNTLGGLDLMKRLPDSVLPAYVRRYQPSKADQEKALAEAEAQLSLYEAKMPESIALHPLESQASREHQTSCLLTRLSAMMSDKLLSSLKRLDDPISITYVGAAAMLLSIRSLWARGHEKGALLGITRNARRWIGTDGTPTSTPSEEAEHQAAIPMATDVVFLWVSFEGLELPDLTAGEPSVTAHQVIALAEGIRESLTPHLLSPHYLSSISVMSGRFIDSLSSSSGKSEALIGPQAPGFSPGGAWAIKRAFTSAAETTEPARLIRHSLHQTGRQVCPSPWMSMYSVDGRVSLTVGYDEKYWEGSDMRSFLNRTRGTLEGVARELDR